MPTYREKLFKKFTEEYARLNEKQREAVDTIEGPVMVIAGPGTGKTQILAARIGKILLETDALPQNILCLTYTEAGVIAMRRRLTSFIGPDAYKVNIYTFHGFCNEVIQDNLSLFEKTALNPVSDLERIRLFKMLIDRLPRNNPLKRYRGDVYFEIRNLKELFSVMKREGWTPAFIKDKIQLYAERIKDDEQYKYKKATRNNKPGDYKPAYFEELDRMEKLEAAVDQFGNFQALMRENNLYDFDDMINWVTAVFTENKNILATYQERFQYILVDEYQDTSGSQNEIVRLLIDFWEEPNVFVVGDDDQSIFRFQGANVENMEKFAGSYASLLKIVLVNNYRSTQTILDASRSLISRNTERLVNKFEGLTKNLVASREDLKNIHHPPLIVEYQSVKDEMADITNKVKALVDEGVPPGNIAVIYKENNYGEQLLAYFSIKKIPAYSKRNIDILKDPFANKIFKILGYLAAEHTIPYSGDELLFEIMHFDFYSIPPIEIARLSVEANTRNYDRQQTSIRQLLYERSHMPARDLFDTGMLPVLKNFSRMLEQLIAAVSNLTLQQLFEQVITRAGILSYIMNSEEKIKLLQILTAIFDFIKEESARNPLMHVKELVDIIESMQHEKLPLPLLQVSGSEDGVNLLTAHGSKGLEFEHVFITGLNAYLWEKKRNPNNGYKYPDTLFSSLPSADANEELRRLLYVALTRAEKHLQLSFVKLKPDNKEAEASMFIAEIIEATGLPVRHIELSQEELMEYEVLRYSPAAPEIEKTEREFIKPLVDRFVMNVTSLNNYLDCPLSFYYKNLIRIPTGKSESLEFGSAVHFALQRLFEEMQKDAQQRFPPVLSAISHFKWYMHRHRENFTEEAFKRRMEQGEIILTAYYNQYAEQWNKIVIVERNIKNVSVNGIPIKGKIDKMEFSGKEINVVDYKTGDPLKAAKKLLSPCEKLPDGGDYWRQAVFYKILIDNIDGRDWRVVSTEFDFIEPDKSNTFQKKKVLIQPADMETVTQQITRVWERIQAYDFYTGCGKEECMWCNFVKENNLAVALHEIGSEEEI